MEQQRAGPSFRLVGVRRVHRHGRQTARAKSARARFEGFPQDGLIVART